MQYIRASDGMTVDRSEACTPAGMVRAGYSIRVPTVADEWKEGEYLGFNIAMADRASSGTRVNFRDTTTIADAEVNRAVTRARTSHFQRHAYMGDRAPTFTDAMAQAVATQFVNSKRAFAGALPTADVRQAQTDTARAMRDTALARRREELRTAWKK